MSEPRELYGGDADATSGAVDQHGFSLPKVGQPIECQRRREVVHRERRCGGIGNARGDGKRVCRRHDDVGRVAAEARECHDAVARPKVDNPRSYAVHHARNFIAWDQWWFGRIGVQPHASHDIREVHASRSNRNQHLSIGRSSMRRLLNGQDFRTTVVAERDLLHGFGYWV